MNNIAISKKYEEDGWSNGHAYAATKAILNHREFDLISIHKTEFASEQDYSGIDAEVVIENRKTAKRHKISIDYKFRNSHYGTRDFLFNMKTRRGNPGWAVNKNKKNNLVISVNTKYKIAASVNVQEMWNAEEYLNNLPLTPAPDGQQNCFVKFEDCYDIFPKFLHLKYEL